MYNLSSGPLEGRIQSRFPEGRVASLKSSTDLQEASTQSRLASRRSTLMRSVAVVLGMCREWREPWGNSVEKSSPDLQEKKILSGCSKVSSRDWAYVTLTFKGGRKKTWRLIIHGILSPSLKMLLPLKGQESSTGTQSRVDQFFKLTAAFWTSLGQAAHSRE